MMLAFAILAFVFMAFVGGVIIDFILCDAKREIDAVESVYNEKLRILETIKLQNNLRSIVRDEIKKEREMKKE